VPMLAPHALPILCVSSPLDTTKTTHPRLIDAHPARAHALSVQRQHNLARRLLGSLVCANPSRNTHLARPFRPHERGSCTSVHPRLPPTITTTTLRPSVLLKLIFHVKLGELSKRGCLEVLLDNGYWPAFSTTHAQGHRAAWQHVL
jgi:hypothetical protein